MPPSETGNPPSAITSPWPHRLAVTLVCATFLLLCVGALVTTLGAGMAFRDWPTSDGHNMFLYPWFKAAGDKFVEHGHRLLGATVGLITIALTATIWFVDRRRWLGWLAALALGMVIGQGILGGLRVRADAVQLAKIHGCTGPAFFALAVALAVFTSPFWMQTAGRTFTSPGGRTRLPAVFITAIVYLQIVLGAQLRHVAADAAPAGFRMALVFHITVAVFVMLYSMFLLLRAVRSPDRQRFLVRPAAALAVMVLLQVGLGAAAWVVKYSWPAGLLAGSQVVAGWTNTAGGWTQSLVVTSHVALGSLIFGTSVLLSLRSLRWEGNPQPRLKAGRALVGAAL